MLYSSHPRPSPEGEGVSVPFSFRRRARDEVIKYFDKKRKKNQLRKKTA
jgi:hypothetical protein